MMSSIIEKILRKKGKMQGDTMVVEVDRIMSHDNTTPLAIEAFKKFTDKQIHTGKIIIVLDHIVPPSFPDASLNQKHIKNFCREYGIKFFEGEGICHTLMIEKGWVQPENIVAGGDSHTLVYGVVGAIGLGMGSTDIAACWKTGKTWLEIPESIKIQIDGALQRGVYPKDVALKYVGELSLNGARGKVIEFCGSTLEKTDAYERMAVGLMATECGAITEIFWDKANRLIPDKNVKYVEEFQFDANGLEPLIAKPHSPDNVTAVSEMEGQEVDQVFIGSCTNGTLHDLRTAATIMKGRAADPYTRTIISPATIQIYNAALKEGLIEQFLKSGALVCTPPGCGPCLGRHLGVLGDGEVCVSTSNRNYRGRMGSPNAEIYLASPATAATTAIEGTITDPRRFM
jgi:3-isopropylmalate dehydratase large subunit